MYRWLLAFLVFVVVSPAGDAINGYLKYPEGSCSTLAVLSPSRMAFLCKDGIAIAQVTAIDLPDLFHPSCLKEALLGIQAMATLKLSLYAADEIRTTGFYRDTGTFRAGVLVDLEGVETIFYRKMEATTLNRTRGDWCST
jgi:hypothetical protein